MQTAAVGSHSTPQQFSLAVNQKAEQEKWQQSMQEAVARVESQLRHIVQKKMIRVSEFFRDFDPLRSGYIPSKCYRVWLMSFMTG